VYLRKSNMTVEKLDYNVLSCFYSRFTTLGGLCALQWAWKLLIIII